MHLLDWCAEDTQDIIDMEYCIPLMINCYNLVLFTLQLIHVLKDAIPDNQRRPIGTEDDLKQGKSYNEICYFYQNPTINKTEVKLKKYFHV